MNFITNMQNPYYQYWNHEYGREKMWNKKIHIPKPDEEIKIFDEMDFLELKKMNEATISNTDSNTDNFSKLTKIAETDLFNEEEFLALIDQIPIPSALEMNDISTSLCENHSIDIQNVKMNTFVPNEKIRKWSFSFQQNVHNSTLRKKVKKLKMKITEKMFWTRGDDDYLKILIKTHGFDWESISLKMRRRSASACRDRYFAMNNIRNIKIRELVL